jgi:hypothetical protein
VNKLMGGVKAYYDLNSSVTIPAAIIDLTSVGRSIEPFDQGRKVRALDVSIDARKITIIDNKMNLHRQVRWYVDNYQFTKTFVTPVNYDFGDTKATLEYSSIEDNDYFVLREPFWCYEDMEDSLPLLSFFGDVFRKLFNVERVSNYIVWSYGFKRFQLKSTAMHDGVCLGDIDCTSMSNLAEFIRARCNRHISRDIIQARVKEHYPEC